MTTSRRLLFNKNSNSIRRILNLSQGNHIIAHSFFTSFVFPKWKCFKKISFVHSEAFQINESQVNQLVRKSRAHIYLPTSLNFQCVKFITFSHFMQLTHAERRKILHNKHHADDASIELLMRKLKWANFVVFWYLYKNFWFCKHRLRKFNIFILITYFFCTV